ncbi:hypothetical protein Aph01nite_56750 [Acrocarpospora phusangensis]|uniref:Prepilin type IV endopeptidase peptidase domain-containing protein n=1 Tax=Acrocarpospora phusangensis TaxID=1070424 RepID=A0A919UTF1_9ACTN|nr:A24 family peptidase [Acrocarpospora phusangensis]GIH27365.1 hypothetical protein Aph01nite_56750 [Acrocarpospora phusangensis]
MSVALVGGLAAAGVVAGAYARALAEGFGPAAEDVRTEDARGEDARGEDARGEDARGEDARTGDVRGEAKAAVLGAVRRWPLPRPPFLAEAATGLAFAVLAWRFEGSPLLAAMLYAVFTGVVLALVDWWTWRLPDVVTLPSYLIVIGLLAPTGRLGVGVVCGLALGGIYLLLWLVRPAGIGLGDVKLAGLLGMVTGAASVNAAIIAGIGAHLLGALYAVGLLVTGKGDRTSEFPFGPFMLLAAFAAVVAEAQ